MSDQENKRLFDHYTNVANGNVKSGNAVRDDLNVSDAKRHLADLVKKNHKIDFDGTGSLDDKERKAEAKAKKDYPEENINKAPEERKPKSKERK